VLRDLQGHRKAPQPLLAGRCQAQHFPCVRMQKRSLFPPLFLNIEMIILPRQARDKCRGNSEKETLFLRCLVPGPPAKYDNPGMQVFASMMGDCWPIWRDQVRKRLLWAPFYAKNARFAKTGSVQT
jgi:hypothetical protein